VKPRRFDSFPFAGTDPELLMLECRLTELYDVVDAFIIVEATVDHQGRPKPLNFLEHQDRYAQWADKLTYVIADRLPTVEEDPWHWAREHAQRGYIGHGLAMLDAQPDDILMQSDCDEIPNVLSARMVNPQREQLISFQQRALFWAIDWEDPRGWNGTTACRVGALERSIRGGANPFAIMRDGRNTPRPINIRNGGWHFSWVGCADPSARTTKYESFCHYGQLDDWDELDQANACYTRGMHVDKNPLLPVDVDESWPKWMQTDKVPAHWFRPR
jgi:hypothetical protein